MDLSKLLQGFVKVVTWICKVVLFLALCQRKPSLLKVLFWTKCVQFYDTETFAGACVADPGLGVRHHRRHIQHTYNSLGTAGAPGQIVEAVSRGAMEAAYALKVREYMEIMKYLGTVHRYILRDYSHITVHNIKQDLTAKRRYHHFKLGNNNNLL